jgi:hypothetical protein
MRRRDQVEARGCAREQNHEALRSAHGQNIEPNRCMSAAGYQCDPARAKAVALLAIGQQRGAALTCARLSAPETQKRELPRGGSLVVVQARQRG